MQTQEIENRKIKAHALISRCEECPECIIYKNPTTTTTTTIPAWGYEEDNCYDLCMDKIADNMPEICCDYRMSELYIERGMCQGEDKTMCE